MVALHKVTVFVATHLPRNLPLLRSPFLEVSRSPAPTRIQLLLRPHRYFKVFAGAHLPESLPLETWSEFGALLARYPWQDKEIVGLAHYRCFLNLESAHQQSEQSFGELPSFLNLQREVLTSMAANSIFVGIPFVFETSAWQQFLDCGQLTRNLEPLLISACRRMDLHLDMELGYTENQLKASNELIARNLFIGPVQFAREWAKVVIDVSHFLAPMKPIDVDPRWAAYIIERLFSVFVLSYATRLGIDLQFKQIIYFN